MNLLEEETEFSLIDNNKTGATGDTTFSNRSKTKVNRA